MFNQDRRVLLVMESMEQTLENFLKEKKGNLSQEKQIAICLAVASGLLLLHQHDPQILHRDLTAKNVLMNREGNVVKISDLGQAKFLHSSINYLTTMVPGCVLYMPPECLMEIDKAVEQGQISQKRHILIRCVDALSCYTGSSLMWVGDKGRSAADRSSSS